MYKKLVIISHTEHYINKENKLLGWGPTIEEINYLSNFWNEVVHVGCLYKNMSPPNSARSYSNNNIAFIPIPPFGGKTIWNKIAIFGLIPKVIKNVECALKEATHVQLRVPMGIGLFLIPYFAIRKRNFIFWVKYANNWNDSKPKLGFRIQRYMLKKNWANCKVTINGSWPNQEKHCFTFENPCLYQSENNLGLEISSLKTHERPFKFLFVGRIEREKGVFTILNWIKNYTNLDDISMCYIIGDGKDKQELMQAISESEVIKTKIKIVGTLDRNAIHEYYRRCHFLLFPTEASEGFPKVVAEASNYGCIPVVSEISCISQYIKQGENGFLWKEFSNENFNKIEITKSMKIESNHLAKKFTFENYFIALTKKIF